jgi:hypothetical protein
MSDHRPDEHVENAGPVDREINSRAIAKSAIWLAVTTVAAFLISWWVYLGLARTETKADPRPSPLAAANQPVEPPEPRLLGTPEKALIAFRAEEKRELEGWSWVDRDAGVAHVPIAVAIDAVAKSGRLPDLSTSPAGAGGP